MKQVRTKLFETVTSRVKETVKTFDPNAEVILFGSRARGDYSAESDWDFLILMQRKVDNELVSNIRDQVFDIELEMETCIFCLVENKVSWDERHFLEINQNVKEDGLLV